MISTHIPFESVQKEQEDENLMLVAIYSHKRICKCCGCLDKTRYKHQVNVGGSILTLNY